jgi:hypothetical protein
VLNGHFESQKAAQEIQRYYKLSDGTTIPSIGLGSAGIG